MNIFLYSFMLKFCKIVNKMNTKHSRTEFFFANFDKILGTQANYSIPSPGATSEHNLHSLPMFWESLQLVEINAKMREVQGARCI